MGPPAGILIFIFCILLRSDIVQPIIVIDGDTLRRDGVIYRLARIDAPEIRRAKCDAERALGIRARERMEQLAAMSGAHIEALPGREKYGRTLARLWIGSKDAGEMLIAEGLARRYDGRKKPDWCRSDT